MKTTKEYSLDDFDIYYENKESKYKLTLQGTGLDPVSYLTIDEVIELRDFLNDCIISDIIHDL